MMTEESNDDTNGESTFEFIGGRPSPGGSSSSSSMSHFSSSAPTSGQQMAPLYTSSGVSSSPNVPLYRTQVPQPYPTGSSEPPAQPLYQPFPPSQPAPSTPQHQPTPSAQPPPPPPSQPTQGPQPTPPYQQKTAAQVQQPSSPPPPNPYQKQPLIQQPTSPMPVYQAPPQGIPSSSAEPVSMSPVATAPSSPPPPYYPPHSGTTQLQMPYDASPSMTSIPTPNIPYGQPYGGDTNDEIRNSGGVWGWIKSSQFLNRFAEKAKNSVDSVITTLDPGMKEHIYSGGDIQILVASDSEMDVSAVREAFQKVFGFATVQGTGKAITTSSAHPPQPVGYSVALKAAEDQISSLKQHTAAEYPFVLVALENFLAELTPDSWFDLTCLLLQDDAHNITLHTYSQATPVTSRYVQLAQEQTPSDYPLAWSGLAVPIGQVIGNELGVPHAEWHHTLTGISHRETILLAARALATLYKHHLGR